MSSTQTKTPMEASAARALATATTEELSTEKAAEPMPDSSNTPAATVSTSKRGKVKKTLFPDSSQESAGTETHDSQDASQEEFVESTPVVDMTELASSTAVASRRRPSGAASADTPRLRQLKSAVLPSPRTGESSSSQAREVGAVDPDIVEHTEYTQRAIQDARYHRAIRRSHPRLWLHSRRCLKSVCLFEGIDDGSNIVKTGVVWRYDEVDFEVVTIVSSGYVSNNTKSSKMDHAVPIYVILRRVSYVGCTISWSHLRRVMVANLFADGTPHAQVNLKTISSEDKRLETFLRQVAGASWRHVEPYESRTALAAKTERNRQHAARAQEADRAKKKEQDQKAAARQQKLRQKQAAAKRQEAERARRVANAKKTRAAAERRKRADARRHKDAVDKAITERLLAFDAVLRVRLGEEIAAGIKDAEIDRRPAAQRSSLPGEDADEEDQENAEGCDQEAEAAAPGGDSRASTAVTRCASTAADGGTTAGCSCAAYPHYACDISGAACTYPSNPRRLLAGYASVHPCRGPTHL